MGKIPLINDFRGLKKQNPRSGSRPGVRILWQATPKVVGAVWVSGAPVAKPIPKIKSCSVRAHRFGHARFACGLTNVCGGVMQHVLSPISAGSLLDSAGPVQSKNTMGPSWQNYGRAQGAGKGWQPQPVTFVSCKVTDLRLLCSFAMDHWLMIGRLG